MQRFALLPSGDRLQATEALPHVDYLCPECHGTVRLRRGEQRAAHFFHRTEGASCHLRGKEGLHRAVQSWLIKALGAAHCTCECHFREISRVADVAYHPLKVVFEVQVSPIDAYRALQRTHDYWSIGWHVIWLLHATTYGRHRATDFEKVLLTIPHYFTDIGHRGGRIWDELSTVRGCTRHWYCLPPLRRTIETPTVDICRPPQKTSASFGFPGSTQLWAERRALSWSCRFTHDLLSSQIPTPPSRNPLRQWRSAWRRWNVLCSLLWIRLIR